MATKAAVGPRNKPKPRKKQTWCIFSQVHSEAADKLMNEARTPAAENKVLTELFNLDTFQGPLGSIILELYHKVLVFCKEKEPRFDAKKLSTLLGIFDTTFKKAVRKDISQEKFYNVFKQLLLSHSVQRPPYSLCVFSAEEIADIGDFFVEEIYKYYPLYHYILHPRYEMTLVTEILFNVGLPEELPIPTEMAEIKPQEVPDLKKFFQQTPEEIQAEAKAKEIDGILAVAKLKLEKEMEEKMKKQDEEFVNEVKVLEKK